MEKIKRFGKNSHIDIFRYIVTFLFCKENNLYLSRKNDIVIGNLTKEKYNEKSRK